MERPLAKNHRRYLLLGLCTAVLLPRAYLAVADQGMVWSDEIFQTLEQGHRLAFGYGLVPWEFRDGARSWLLPGVLAGGMKALAAFGASGGATLAVAWKLGFALLGAVTFVAILRAAHALGDSLALVLAGVWGATLPVGLVYGSRVLAEVASAPCLAWGLCLLLPWGLAGRLGPRPLRLGWPERRQVIGAGLLLGLGTLLRYQNGILLPVILLIVTLRRGWRAAFWLAAAMAAGPLAGGLLDLATWGRPFQSLVVYVRFNLLESGANQWGVAEREFYLRTLLATNGPAVLLLAAGVVAGLRRAWPLALLAVLYVGVLSAIPHKELRFLYPVVPIFVLCAAVGVTALVRCLPCAATRQKWVGLALGVGAAALFVPRARGVTFADLGQPMPPPAIGGPTSSLVWRAFDERNRLLVQAGKHADLCGLVAPAMNPYWTGGYTYLRRRVPMLWTGSPHDRDAANYLVLGPGQALGDPRYREVAKAGPYALLRRDGPCRKPAPGSTTYGRLSPAGVMGP